MYIGAYAHTHTHTHTRTYIYIYIYYIYYIYIIYIYICIHTYMYIWPNTGFEFGRQHECITLLKDHKCQKILQTDRSFVFCFMFSLENYAFL